MPDVSVDYLMAKDEEQRYQRASQNLKLRNQIYTGVGAAIVFGLVGAISKLGLDALAGEGIIATMVGSTGMAAAIGGATVLGCAVLGFACLYWGSQFFSQSVALDQDMSARKIQAAADKQRQAVQEQAISSQMQPIAQPGAKLPGTATQGAVADEATADIAEDAPTTQWSRKFTPAAAREIAPREQTASWVDKSRSSEGAAVAPTLH